MKISCILVHYHTPLLLKRAVSAIENDAISSGLEAEIIVVDNGSLEEDRQLLNSLSVKLVKPGENLGYAGGVNLGVKNSGSDVFILMNPDVEVLPGCVGALLHALEDGASAAGPRFYLDPHKEILLPPLIELTPKNEIMWRLSALGGGIASQVRNNWRKHAKEQWLATSPTLNYNLTGALLAITRQAWEKVGEFDEIFKLYFEEADWLMRLRKKGLRACFVPSARAIHQVSQSASKEERSKKWYSESLRTYRRRYYGALFTAFLEHVVPVLGNVLNIKQKDGEEEYVATFPSIELTNYQSMSEKPIWIEISTQELGIPALGVPIHNFGLKEWVFPPDNWQALEPGKYYFRVVDNQGRELGSSVFLHNVTD